MSAGDKKVGLFLIGGETRYQRQLAEHATAAARRHAFDLEIFYSDNLAVQQSQDIVRFVYTNLDRQVCVIVMPVADVDSDAKGPILEHPFYMLGRRVTTKGAGWIVLNRDAEEQLSALRQEFPSAPIGLVTPDQREFGRIQGRQFRTLLPKGGRVLYVLGKPFTPSSRERRAGMMDAIAGTPIQINEVTGMWSTDQAREAVCKWLLSPARANQWPDLIGCQNDEMGIGARDALAQVAKELNQPALADVPITGGDGLPDAGQRWVAQKKLVATIIIPATSGLAIDLLAQTWVSGRPMPLKTVLQPVSHPPMAALVGG